MQQDKISLDELFMSVAKLTSLRGSCKRLKVGAVITKGNHIISSGYNGAVAGMSNCDEVGCMLDDGHCVRTIHAELNAIIQCTSKSVDISGSTIYTTHFPCVKCLTIIAQANIKCIKYASDYRGQSEQVKGYSRQIIDECGIKLEKVALSTDHICDMLTSS